MSDEVDARWGKRSPMHEPRLLAGFRPRPTDVLVTTAPKCGTTWMQQILHQLRSGGDTDYATIYSVVPWIEAPDATSTVEAQLARYEVMSDPRVFKTHCTVEQTPGLDLVRLVLTFRDPRDACVSMFHHKRDMTREAAARIGLPVPTDLDAHIDQWLTFGSWYRNVRGWWPERDRPNLRWFRYEDLVADLAPAIDALSDFLGWRLDAARRATVLEQSSFAWMRAHQTRFTRMRADDPSAFEPRGFIRKGVVGDWRTQLTPAQADRILTRVRAEVPPGCLEALGYV